MPAHAARRARSLFLPGAALCALALGACIASAPEGIRRQTDGDDGDPIIEFDGGYPVDATPDVPGSDPHALIGAEPAHGPFPGGGRVLVRGNGFTAETRVWFGAAEADAATMVPIDPTRLQISAPPGSAGPVELAVQNGDDASTRRTLPGGYAYDALYAQPSSGPVSGGTVVEIIGQGTSWGPDTTARIGGKPCTTLSVESSTKLRCTAPQGTPGSKPVTVDAGDGGASLAVLDAYAYEDSNNGFKGGLSGAPLAGKLKVLAYDNFTGDPLVGAHVIVGSDVASALVKHADGAGLTYFDDPALDGPRTITIAAKCHSPITFVDVPVDTVTAYLDPILSPICIGDGDPPPVGGKPAAAGGIQGELVWGTVNEFEKAPWINVPPPGPGERQAAYVFLAASDPTAAFQLPPASAAITPAAPGELGYGFYLGSGLGNRAVYALAGIEDQSSLPYKFTAYAMGEVQGVSVQPNVVTEHVYLMMDRTLDQALTMNVAPPAPGPKGPDRVRATVAVTLGNDGYAILPAGQKSPLLPLAGPLSFVGLPALDGSLFGSAYLSTARAVTGPAGAAPLSVVGRLLTTSTAQGVSIDGFVGVPTLTAPAPGAKWDGRHLATSFGAGGSAIDLSVYEIASGNGLVSWTVVVPKGSHAIEVPDLSAYPFPEGALPAGPISISVHGGRVEKFAYAKLLYRDIRPSGMAAYALDAFPSFL